MPPAQPIPTSTPQKSRPRSPGASVVQVSRPLVGILALACLGIAAVMWVAVPADAKSAMWLSAFVRVGMLLGAFWVALPARGRPAAWASLSPQFLLGLGLALFAIVYRPRVVLPLVVVLGTIGYFLRPRSKKRPPRAS